jgi:sugar lactone lactonase YvrE
VRRSANVPVEVAVEVDAEVGEGPLWDAETGSLWFVDLTAGDVYRYTRDRDTVTRFSVGQEVGAVLLRRDGGLVLAVRDGIATATEAGDDFEVRVPVELDTANRMNDAKCDPAGRLYAGTTAFDFTPRAGSLYRIDAEWSCTPVVTGLTVSNGLAWSPDGSRMYLIDSATQSVDTFDYDVASGDMRARRRLVALDAEAGTPDGMTVDEEGNLWVACFGGASVRCFSPSGQELERISFPVRQVTSCAFGGPGYSELYVTSAAYRMTAAELNDEPLAGATFVCRPGVAGLPAVAFAG